jgi:plastocyanin
LAALVAITLTVAACQRSSGPVAAHRSPTPLDPSTTGTITGRVHVSGTKPPPRHEQVTSDSTCVAAHPDGLDVDDVRGDDGMLADVFVYVARGLEDRVFAVPETPVVVDQRGCVFEPRVAGAQVGQPIAFVNGDDTLHNVHGTPTKSSAWNFGLAVRGARRTITIDHPEVPVGVQCDVHPWMHATLAVVDHPYFAVTGDDGVFTLARVPAGRYTVAAWHPRLGTREREVEVAAGATATVDLSFAL